jgi:hypothetical protein
MNQLNELAWYKLHGREAELDPKTRQPEQQVAYRDIGFSDCVHRPDFS